MLADFRGFAQENGAFSRIIKEICKNQGQEGIFRAILLDFNDVLRQKSQIDAEWSKGVFSQVSAKFTEPFARNVRF
jgi:hypothetical protein